MIIFFNLIDQIIKKNQSRTSILRLCLIILFLSNVASGGRSAIFVSAIFIVLSFYIRRKLDLSAIPQSNLLRASSLAFVLIMIFYTNYIWYVRSELTNTGFEEFLSHAETVWGVTPTSALVNFADWLGRPELVKDLLSTIFYFTQCLSVGEKVLSMPSTPLLLGSYQIDLISVLFRLTPYLSEIMRNGYNDLNDFGVYGFFSGAWFSLLIDFGFFGALLFTAVWGWLSGVAFRYARHSRHLELYAFSLYAILISFVSPPLGFANSAVTFFWFFLYFFIKNRSFFKTLYHIRQ